jgi:hypothetical protein
MTRTNSIRLRLMTLSLLSGLTLLSPLLGEGPRVKKQDPAVYFWYYFRTAVMANQFQKIELLTRFPFERTTAEGATTRLAKGAFREKVIGLLDLSDGAGRTMRALIEQKEDLTPAERAALSGGELTIGLFRFKTIKEKCYWVGSIETENLQAKTSLPGTPLAAKPTMDTATPPVKPTGKPIDENPALAPSALQTAETPQSPQEIVDPRTDSVFRFYWIEFRRAALSSDFEKMLRINVPLAVDGLAFQWLPKTPGRFRPTCPRRKRLSQNRMNNGRRIHFKFNSACFQFFHRTRDVKSHRPGFRVRHEPFGSEGFGQFRQIPHGVGRGHQNIKIHPAF